MQAIRRSQLMQSLDADLDRCWAAQSATEEATTSFDDSWDQNDAEYSSSSGATSMPMLENFSGTRGVDTLWPLAARSAVYTPAPGQQAWLHDLSQVLQHSHFDQQFVSCCSNAVFADLYTEAPRVLQHLQVCNLLNNGSYWQSAGVRHIVWCRLHGHRGDLLASRHVAGRRFTAGHHYRLFFKGGRRAVRHCAMSHIAKLSSEADVVHEHVHEHQLAANLPACTSCAVNNTSSTSHDTNKRQMC